MTLKELAEAIPLTGKSHGDLILIFGWFLHSQRAKQHFQPAEVKQCYGTLNIPQPGTFGSYFAAHVHKKRLLKNTSGYRLSAESRAPYDKLKPQLGFKVQITKLLADLPAKLPNLAEKAYLEEALICYAGALSARLSS